METKTETIGSRRRRTPGAIRTGARDSTESRPRDSTDGRPLDCPSGPRHVCGELSDLTRGGYLLGQFLLRVLEVLLEVLAVGVDYLLDRLFGVRERLVERITRDSPITTSAAVPASSVSPSSKRRRGRRPCGSVRQGHRRRRRPPPRRGSMAGTAPRRAHRPRSLHRRCAGWPSSACGRELAFVVLVDHCGVISADKLLCMKVEQDVVVATRIVGAGIGCCVDENRSIAHQKLLYWAWSNPRREALHGLAASRLFLATMTPVLRRSSGRIGRYG